MTGIQPLTMFGTGNENNNSFSAIKSCDNGDHSKIWRARSFEETRGHAVDDNYQKRSEDFHDDRTPGAGSLHTSFDRSYLDNNDVHGSAMFDSQTSWDDDADPSLGDLSGRKHLLQQAAVEATEVIQPGTVRKKIARRTPNNLSSKTPGRPSLRQSGSSAKKFLDDNTPSSSAKRRRAPLSQLKSPMQRVEQLPPGFPFASSPHTALPGGAWARNQTTESKLTMTPTRPGIGANFSTLKSMSRYHNTGTTAASTHLETTIESDSVDTLSPTTTRFKFTSFPASLPRVNNPRNRQCPDSVRKRMSFGEPCDSNDANQLKDDDGTHNTSISSLSGDGGVQILAATNPPAVLEWKCNPDVASHVETGGPAHARLFRDDDNFGDSDDDSSASPVHGIVGRTRLNFNLLLTPPETDAKQEARRDPGKL